MLPILVTQHFGGAAQQFGWMESVWGAGVVLGGIALGVWGGFERRIVTLLAGLTGLGFTLFVIGLTPGSAFVPALVLMFFAGTLMSIHSGPFSAVIQASVAPDMQGRVLSLINSATSLIAPVSLAIAGPLSDSLGAQVWYVLGGGLCVMMGLTGLTIPALLRIEDHHRDAAPAHFTKRRRARYNAPID